MSKAPIERHGKLLRPSEFRDSFSCASSKAKIIGCGHTDKAIPHSTTDDKLDIKIKEPAKKGFMSLIPKMNLNLEQNPRIHDLREKLNEITKKQKSVDKQTKGLINGITQQLVVDKDVDESGPYSLLFDLQPDTSTSSKESTETHSWRTVKEELSETKQNIINKSTSCLRSAERLPNVLHFDDKPMREFEYSCENEFNFPAKHIFNTHSRSDLCLQLKSYTPNRPLETNQSPMENSRANDENSLDDSLGILTPDQMDDMCYLENTFSPTVEGLPVFSENKESKISPDNGDTPSTDKTESNSAASTIQNDGFEHKDIKKSAPETLCDSIKEHRQKEYTEHQVLITAFANSVCVSVNQTPKISVSVQNNKDNFIENEEILFVKEDVLVEEEFMPSIHSSILEPASSIAEPTVNLEIPLDCKHDNRVVINRIEQTPSPEDLPLDASDINGEISTYSQFSVSTLHDSQTFSDSKNDYPKSMETSKVSNSFITSITSITSLDGYQGDGEMSRPVSRGADHSIENREDVLEMDWQNVPVTRRADPMTDSDFFTESDADGLDDSMQRGDRRAQVIDGALYGGKNGNGNQPLIVNRNDDSCMESSGVYTDFENHRSSPVFLHAIDDNSPEGSTPSIRSECSQKNIRADESVYFTPESNLQKPESPRTDEKPSGNLSKRNSVNSEKDIRCNEKKEEKRSFTLKKYKMPKRDVPSKLKSMLTNRKTEVDTTGQSSPKTVKKIERRDNFSKKNSLELKSDGKTKSFKDIKSKVDSSFSLQRSQTACSVNRLTSKSTNINTKPKSRHLRMRMELGSATGSGKSSLHSSQSDISALSTPLGKHPTTRFPLLRNGKKREGVPTPAAPRPAPPPTPPTIVKKPATNGVVQKLSASPVSVRGRTLAPPPSPRKMPHRAAPAQRPNTLPTSKEPPRVTAALGPRGKRVQTPQTTHTPLPAPLPASLPAPLPAPLEPAPKEQSDALAHATKGVEALGVLVQYLVFRLDALNGGAWKAEAERWRGVAAAERTSAARADRDRQQRAQKDLDTIAECLSKISELEMEVSTKEEATARLQATHIEEVSALASDIKNLKDTIESLKREVSESRARLHAHSEIERTLRAQLDAARAELQAVAQRRDVTDAAMHRADVSTDMSGAPPCKCDAACDPVHCELEECELRLGANEELSTDANELAAEVRSLRAVVELKQAEMASLRDARTELEVERERRAAAERDARSARHAAEELRERAAARQREADRLKDDNRRLRDAAARDRDHATRLAALNEELRYKLRQKSQVVSLLAGGGYMERRARTLSSESARSVTPPPSPPSPASSPAPSPPTPPTPAVKGVVEKHDSVSWVLEIEETPEEVASRLARKSSFRNGASPSGVKRRGGGSPGSGSPAPASPAPNASKLFRPGDLDFPPAPPPLKESAGEAIYIYDDRQY